MSKKDFLNMTPQEREAKAKTWEKGISFDETRPMSKRSQSLWKAAKRGRGRSKKPAAAKDVRVTSRHLVVVLTDGREISIPLSFYPTLAKASPTQRSHWELIGTGRAISWESLNLDLSVQFLLEGAREGIPKPPPMLSSHKPRKSA